VALHKQLQVRIKKLEHYKRKDWFKSDSTAFPIHYTWHGKHINVMSAILFVNGSIKKDEVGSIQELVHRLAKKQIANNNEVVLLSRRIDNEDPSYENINGMHIYRMHTPRRDSIMHYFFPFYSIVNSLRIWKKITARHDIDVINYHTPFPAFGLRYYIDKSKVKTVFHMHHPKYLEIIEEAQSIVNCGLKYPAGMLFRYIEQKVLESVDEVVCHSSFVKEIMTKKFGVDPPRCKIIKPGVDVCKFNDNYDIGEVRRQLGIPDNCNIAFTSRGDSERYGVPALVRAFKRLEKASVNIKLIIGGKAGDASRIKKLVQSHSLADTVFPVGFISSEKLPLYFQAADFFVLPTKALEGFGYVILESLACNTPVLGTPVGAIPEVLGQFNDQLLFDNTSPKAMARLIRRAVENPSSINLYQNYRKDVKRMYKWDNTCSKYASVFE